MDLFSYAQYVNILAGKSFFFSGVEKSLSLENDKSKIVKMNDDKERREHQCP